MKDEKARFRSAMKQMRNMLSLEQRIRGSASACRHASEWIGLQGIRSLLVYVPFRSELDTKPLIEWAWQQGIDVYVPRCMVEDHSMTLHRLQDWNELKTGAYGISEPDPMRVQAASDEFIPEAVFVPGLAFDKDGGRLGYGAGYYDRLHARLAAAGKSQSAVWAGIGFAAQVVDEVPMEPSDARLQVLITENGVRSMDKGADDGTYSF